MYLYQFPNNKVYIGKSFVGGNRYKQVSSYKMQLVYKAMQKYPNFKSKILEYFLSEQECFEAEIRYIKQYNSTNPKYGYNVSQGGDGADPVLVWKPIYQYSLRGKLLRKWDSIIEAAANYKLKSCSIIAVAKGRSLTAGGFQWCYEGEQDKIKDLGPQYHIGNRQINQYDLRGNYIKTWNSVLEAKKAYGSPKIYPVCEGKTHTAAGYQWRFVDSSLPVKDLGEGYYQGPIKVFQYQNNHFIRSWNSIQEAADALHIDRASISKCCSHRRLSAGGFQWEYNKKENNHVNSRKS